jgi:hypothetical protein
VRFIGHEPQRAAIETRGFRFEAYPTARPAHAAAPGGMIASGVRQARVFADRALAADVIAASTCEPTDVVVIDCLLVRATTDAIAAGLPVVSLMHTLWSFWMSAARGPVGLLVGAFGGRMSRAFGEPKLALVTTRVDFEERTDFAPNVVHTGIVLSGIPVSATTRPEGRPRVLVSLSTTNMPGQHASMQRILDGIGTLEIDAVMTTGPAIDATVLRIPSNAQVHEYLDHNEVLPTVSLVIGHGGHSTTARALAHGVPVLVLPQNPLIDQPAIGRAVERLGVGRTLPATASPERIRGTVLGMLTTGQERERAASLGADIRRRDGATVAVDAIDAFVARVDSRR